MPFPGPQGCPRSDAALLWSPVANSSPPVLLCSPATPTSLWSTSAPCFFHRWPLHLLFQMPGRLSPLSSHRLLCFQFSGNSSLMTFPRWGQAPRPLTTPLKLQALQELCYFLPNTSHIFIIKHMPCLLSCLLVYP